MLYISLVLQTQMSLAILFFINQFRVDCLVLRRDYEMMPMLFIVCAII